MTAAAAGIQLDIQCIPLGPIGTNCYLVRPVGAERGIVIDPGGNAPELLAHCEQTGFGIDAIVITHCHWDHIGAVAAVAAATGAPVWMGATEAPALETPGEFQFPGMPEIEACAVDHRLEGGERVEIAGMTFDVLLVPGHSPGHLAFVAGAASAADGEEIPPMCFIGDVIFRGSIGRTDLPYANHAQLMQSLDHIVASLDPQTILLPGHGDATQLAHEIATNPFLREH